MKDYLAVTDTITVCIPDISAIEKGDGYNFAFKIYLRGSGEPLIIDKCLPEVEEKLKALFFEKQPMKISDEALKTMSFKKVRY
jgi:hypothetical protein